MFKRGIFVIAMMGIIFTAPMAEAAASRKSNVEHIKHQIVQLAESFYGQGDPDYSKQKKIEVLVGRLLTLAPQPSIKDRLNYLYGTWKQVWGPYDYRNDDRRGVDPELGIEEIYQSIFPGGYYYNISPLYRDGDHKQVRTGLLRGEYELDKTNSNRLNVHFTSYRGIEGRPPENTAIWKLAPMEESDTLDNEATIVPWLIVQLFFGSGSLDEIYTDNDLRICYGSNGNSDARKAIYVMTKVKDTP